MHVYRYSEVLAFVKESQPLLNLLKAKIERIHEAACETVDVENYILKTSRVTGVLFIGPALKIED